MQNEHLQYIFCGICEAIKLKFYCFLSGQLALFYPLLYQKKKKKEDIYLKLNSLNVLLCCLHGKDINCLVFPILQCLLDLTSCCSFALFSRCVPNVSVKACWGINSSCFSDTLILSRILLFFQANESVFH